MINFSKFLTVVASLKESTNTKQQK